MNSLDTLQTPAAVIDVNRMERNIGRMQQRMDSFGVRFRPHVKTTKCASIVHEQLIAGAYGITVSTLKEAEVFFDQGVTDILYAVGMVPAKLGRVLALKRRGCDLKIITDNVYSADAIAAFGREHSAFFQVFLEIDTDGHRSGIRPDDPTLINVARTLHRQGMGLAGVLTHAGSSYGCYTLEALAARAEQERAGCVFAADRLREQGLPCPAVSVGSTPTALAFHCLNGVTEVRAGVYVFFDLVMTNIGVCTEDDIALSVLTTVIGHQVDKGLAIVDAGWMAMSRDRGTQNQKRDYGYGQICWIDGSAVQDYVLSGVNQEHGIVSHRSKVDTDISSRFPVGMQLRVLPNHACATGAQFSEYHALDRNGNIAVWKRVHGW